MPAVALLVATRKGAFILRSDDSRRKWATTGPMLFGQTVFHLVLEVLIVQALSGG